jgi:hypothetical protein
VVRFHPKAIPHSTVGRVCIAVTDVTWVRFPVREISHFDK